MLANAGGLTDTGMVREHNEDALLIEPELGLFAVADGMGGQQAGEVASRMAVDVLKDYIRRTAAGGEALIGSPDGRHSTAANHLASGIRLANRVIFESAQSNPSWRTMGSTIVAVLLDGSRAAIAHVGDSRIYLIRGASIVQLTEDHSLVAEQQRQGLLSKEQAAASPLKNVITRALGQDLEVEVDLKAVDIGDNDRLLLCSDGLTNMISDEEILAIVTTGDDPDQVCRMLINEANRNGGNDNITAVLIHLASNGFFSGIRRFLGRG